MSGEANKPIETLRLGAADKQKLIDYVEHTARKPVQDCKRGLRVNFAGRKVLVKITSSEGQSQVCSVVPRNLSRRGLAFVHGRFVYPDSECEVTLPMLSGKWCVLRGVIRRCRHVNGIVHEVSVVFDESIDLNQFLRLNSEQAERHLSEMTEDGLGEDDLSGSRGRVLIVDDLAADRRLFKMWVEKLGFAVKEAGDVGTVLQLLNQNRFDLYIVDANLGDEDGIELIMHLRGQGVIAPVISASANDTDEFKKRANDAGASAVMTKPFDFEALKHNVFEVMSIDEQAASDDSPLYSDLANDADMVPLIDDFVKGLAVYVAKLRSANAEADFDNLSKLCRNLKGAGSSHGFEPVSSAAEIIIDSLGQQEKDINAVRTSVNSLLHVIQRVQAAYNAA
ncbi:MAG: response regulator [Planctomycetota bacterium]